MDRASKFHQWAFNQLYEYVEYKAEAFGIDVVQVNPRNTSRRCSKCGHTAKNIGIKHVHAGQKSPRGRANYQLALKSGALNASNEFSSAETSA